MALCTPTITVFLVVWAVCFVSAISLFGKQKVPCFAFSPLKIYHAAKKKNDQMLSLHLKFTRMGENCSLVGVLVGEDTARLFSQSQLG